jgi:hypothetical protein
MDSVQQRINAATADLEDLLLRTSDPEDRIALADAIDLLLELAQKEIDRT